MRTEISDLTVELWASRLPRLFHFAEHCWLVIRRAAGADRWEVWQEADVGGDSWGHVHRNLFAPETGISQNPAYHQCSWSGRDGIVLANRIEQAPDAYPWCQTYHYVPGPNSNTFVQWCLQDLHQLGWRSVGRGFASRVTRSRACQELPVIV